MLRLPIIKDKCVEGESSGLKERVRELRVTERVSRGRKLEFGPKAIGNLFPVCFLFFLLILKLNQQNLFKRRKRHTEA